MARLCTFPQFPKMLTDRAKDLRSSGNPLPLDIEFRHLSTRIGQNGHAARGAYQRASRSSYDPIANAVAVKRRLGISPVFDKVLENQNSLRGEP